MRKVNNYTIQKESFMDMNNAGRWNPCLEITFRDKAGIHTHKLSAGYQDEIHIYREYGITFILTTNSYLGYVGLEAFEGSELAGDLFLEYHNMVEVLGRCDLAPFTMIQRLRNHIHS
ncbi:hypothetical protein ACFL03_15835 [Thermodesulfobacteriota bacterium]